MKNSKRKIDGTSDVPPVEKTQADKISESFASELDGSTSDDLANSHIETKVFTSEPATPGSVAIYTLNANCTVRDSAALRTSLLNLLIESRPVAIDARFVDRIDTAAMQLLYAFVRDRRARGGVVSLIGTTEGFSEATRLLGMQVALGTSAVEMSGVAA